VAGHLTWQQSIVWAKRGRKKRKKVIMPILKNNKRGKSLKDGLLMDAEGDIK
jgi:hypothetical protein